MTRKARAIGIALKKTEALMAMCREGVCIPSEFLAMRPQNTDYSGWHKIRQARYVPPSLKVDR